MHGTDAVRTNRHVRAIHEPCSLPSSNIPEHTMKITACAVPSETAVDQRFAKHAHYRDSYCVHLRRADQSVVGIFHAIFGHRPVWMKALFVVRNTAVALFGIATPATGDIMNPTVKPHYKVGDTIGSWPIFALTDTELIAGRDNSHLDFRLSILKRQDGDRTTVAISTLCDVHNAFGKTYLACIVPFHTRGIKWLISRAVAAGRL
jgi:Protein of unknown function (DUF2867)